MPVFLHAARAASQPAFEYPFFLLFPWKTCV
jgi:hypothetical protein